MAFPGLAWLLDASLAWLGQAFSLKMRTTLERELCFQEIAFTTLAGFLRPAASKKGGFLSTQNLIPLAWFVLVFVSGLVWPPLDSPGLLLASLWSPFGLPWPLLGLPLASLDLSLASFGVPLVRLGLFWRTYGGAWRRLGASLVPLSVSWRVFSHFL